MGNSIRTFLKKAGCTDRVLNSLFATNFEHLISSIEKDDLEKVKFYHLVKNVSFSDYLPSGDSPLHVAVAQNHMDIVKYIIENVSFLNIEDKNFSGDTVFMIATLKGKLEMMKYLLEVAKSDVDTRENKGATPFFAACCNGYMEILEYFLYDLKIDYHTVNYEGQTAVHRVAYYGLLDVLKYLKKNTSLSFSSIDKKGNSPLHLAAMRLNIACMRYLLKHSSKKEVLLNQKNSEDETPISILLKILNKIKDPGISEITKEEVIKYINDKKNPPPIRNNEVKLRSTLIATSMKKTDNYDKKSLATNNLKLPTLTTAFPGRTSKDSQNPNISPKTLKITSKREQLMSKVTPLFTEKHSLIPPSTLMLPIGSKNNLGGSKTNILPPEPLENEVNDKEKMPEEHEIRSVLVRPRDKRGKKSNTPSPEKVVGNSPKNANLGKSPGNKLRSLWNKLNNMKTSFLTSPKKKKPPVVNINKQYTKGLSFKEMNENYNSEDIGIHNKDESI